MRFHASAVIDCSEPGRVSRMLEENLRDTTIDVVRTGAWLTLIGLGPGAVSMNKDDITVLTFEEGPNTIFIEADGVFDGQYLDDPTAVEAVVCSKLERAFVAVQEQIDRQGIGRKKEPVRFAAAGKDSIEHTASGDAEQHISQAGSAVEVLPVKGGRLQSITADPHDEARVHRLAGLAPHFRQIGFFAVTALGIGMIAIGLDGVQRVLHRDRKAAPPAKTQIGVASIVPKMSPVVNASRSVDSNAVPAETDVSVSGQRAVLSTAAAKFKDMSSDPVVWLNHWERAMRSRDAEQQSSFYADLVDRYQGEAHVSQANVEMKKRQAIASREGLWTIKVESAVIQKRTKDAVEFRLVKHIMYQPAQAQISEEFVRTQLQLRRVDGAWKIVSEVDLAQSPAPLAPLT